LHEENLSVYYAKWSKGEVDMVEIDANTQSPRWALEIKWSNHFFEKPGDLKSLLQYLRDNDLKNALVTTIDIQGSKTIDDINLTYIPAAIYAYTIGRNSIEKKHRAMY
jgi:hypothetical protein